MVKIREYSKRDLPEMIRIWNTVVEDGMAFPQEECLEGDSGKAFFASQSYSGVAYEEKTDRIVGLYILHPNNIGRCAHIANASYAVLKECRDQHIGEKLVADSLEVGKRLGFKILQFNAVVNSNASAKHLYERLGFIRLGTIPGGFRNKAEQFEDIVLYYHTL